MLIVYFILTTAVSVGTIILRINDIIPQQIGFLIHVAVGVSYGLIVKKWREGKEE